MRILLLNYEFPPLGGGASQAAYFMVEELTRHGHAVDVLTSSATGRSELESLGNARIFRVRSWRRGVHEAGLIGVATYLWFAFLELRRLLRDNDYDIAHFFFALPTGVLALYWRYRTGKPYIISLRGSDVPEYDPANGTLRLLHRVFRPLARRILRGATHVVANSRSLRELALRAYPEVRISVITNGVDGTLYHPGSNKGVLNSSAVRALSVARLVRRKGLETMLQALARDESDAVKLDIVGDGPLIRELQALAAALDITSKVDFLGALAGEQLRGAYQRADFFVLPSLCESFSMSLLEAMASGLPVVASDVGGIPELVTPEENGILVPPGDAAALASAMRDVARSPLLRRSFAKNNRAKIEEEYSWARITSQYMRQCYADTGVEDLVGAAQPSRY